MGVTLEWSTCTGSEGWHAQTDRCKVWVSAPHGPGAPGLDGEFDIILTVTIDQGREAVVGEFDSPQIARAAAVGIVELMETYPVMVSDSDYSRKRLTDALRVANDDGVPDSPFACCSNCAASQVVEMVGEDATASFFCVQEDDNAFDEFGILRDNGVWIKWYGDSERICDALRDAGFQVTSPRDESVAIHVLPGTG